MDDQDRPWLTPAEAARLLGCSPNTARNYADAQKVDVDGVGYPLRVTRVGPNQSRRLCTADVEAIAAALRVTSGSR